MTVTIELSAEEEARVREKAAAAGRPFEDYVRHLIIDIPDVRALPNASATVGAQFLDRLRADGAVGIWKDRADSPELARELRHQAERRAAP